MATPELLYDYSGINIPLFVDRIEVLLRGL